MSTATMSRPTPSRCGHHPISLAPMMDRTDRHFRYLLRQISHHALLYTEMVVAQAVIHGVRPKLLGYDPQEHPIALQLGGDDPTQLAECSRIATDWGYDEINLNVGCPSDRVQKGNFGACLMADPGLVARCVEAMRAVTDRPVTVKHRIGIDELDSYELLTRFVGTVAAAGCDRFSVHARKAWLQGLDPKQNRTVPPLVYETVYRLKQDFPELIIEINGGITDLEQAATHLQHVDGVMIGRAVYDQPYLFAEVDRNFYGDDTPTPSRHQVVERMLPYIESWIARGGRLHNVTRHMLLLFHGCAGSRAWKQILTIEGCRPGAGTEVVQKALAAVPPC